VKAQRKGAHVKIEDVFLLDKRKRIHKYITFSYKGLFSLRLWLILGELQEIEDTLIFSENYS